MMRVSVPELDPKAVYTAIELALAKTERDADDYVARALELGAVHCDVLRQRANGYPEKFPTAIAHGACAERLKHRKLAIHRYRAVVLDAVHIFGPEVDDFFADGLPAQDERRGALQYALDANRRLEYLDAGVEGELAESMGRISRLLAVPPSEPEA